MVDAVDLPADEDADPTVAPLAPVGQQEGNQQSQTCKHKHTQVQASCELDQVENDALFLSWNY